MIDARGDKDLTAGTRADANNFLDALIAKGLAGGRMARVSGIVRSVFNFTAAEVGITVNNRFAGAYYVC